MRFALFREVPKRQHRKKRKLNSGAALRKGSDGSGGDDESDESEGEQDPASAPAERMASPRAPPSSSKAGPAQLPEDPIWGDESQDVQMTTEPPASAGDGTIPPER